MVSIHQYNLNAEVEHYEYDHRFLSLNILLFELEKISQCMMMVIVQEKVMTKSCMIEQKIYLVVSWDD